MKAPLLGLVMLMLSCTAHALSYADVLPCEPLDPNQKYHDINDPEDQVLRGTVERNHFLPFVETLQKGQTAPLPRDIAFALRAFPNHYRALNAMARWHEQNTRPLDVDNLVWTADCYFLRAIEFRPQDWKIRFIYGIYLHKMKRYDEAEDAYATAEKLGAHGAEFYYNRGLLEVDEGHLDQAAADADKAYELGYPLKGLRGKLERARSQLAPRSVRKSSAAASAAPANGVSSPQ